MGYDLIDRYKFPIRFSGTILQLSAALWIIWGYVLPHAMISRFTFRALLANIEGELFTLPGISCAAVCFILTLIGFYKHVSKRLSGMIVWCMIFAYGTWYLAGAYQQHFEPEFQKPYALISIALSAGLIVAFLCGTPERLAYLLVPIITIQSCYGIINYIIADHFFWSGTIKRAVGTFSDPQDLCRILYVGLPLSWALSHYQEKQLFWGYIWRVCFSIMLIAMFLTFDRGGLLAISVGLGWMAYRISDNKKAAIYTIGVLVALFVAGMCIRSAGPVNQVSSANSVKGRYQYWKESLAILRRNPLGVGVNGLVLHAYWGDGKSLMGSSDDPKSMYLLWLDIMGLPGGAFLCLAILGGVRILRNKPSAILNIAIGSAWLNILIAGIFDTPIGNIASLSATPLAAALLGTMLRLPVTKTDHPKHITQSQPNSAQITATADDTGSGT